MRFVAAAGHISNVATVLAELSEKLDSAALAKLADFYAVPEVQRCGYLLEHLGEHDLAGVSRRLPFHPGADDRRLRDEERDRLADRSLPAEKKDMVSRDRVAAPAGIAAPSPAAEPQLAAKAESASRMRIGQAVSPCESARTLAAEGRLREAETAQRACLAQDPSAPTQEKGLIFLAELLDRQARFAEADSVITEVGKQFPQSRPLDLYRQQRPMVQKQQMPAPVTR